MYRKKYSLLWLYALAGFIANMLIAIVLYGKPERLPVANAYIITEFVLLFFFFKQQLQYPKYKAAFIINLLILVIGISNIFYKDTNGFAWSNFMNFNAFSAALFSFSYILFCILGFVKILQEKSVLFLERSSFFWANTAIFIYTSGIFFLFLFTQYLFSRQMDSYVGQLWQINDTLLILKSILLSISFLRKRS